MQSDHGPDTGNVVRFPVERRAKPTLLLAQELAPPSDLTEAMADERAAGEPRQDTMAATVELFTNLAKVLEARMGQDNAAEHLRALAAAQVSQACTLGWRYRDAEADANEAAARLKQASGAGASAGCLDEQVRRTRALWTEAALAARAATDAALGSQAALDFYERGEPWRRQTGAEHGRWLVEQAARFKAGTDQAPLPA